VDGLDGEGPRIQRWGEPTMRGHVQRRGKHSWRLKWELSRDPRTGTRITRQKTVVGTKREAEAELARVLGAIQAGRYVDPTKMTVGDLLAKWRDDVASVSVAAKTFGSLRGWDPYR
jgi:hypothetical protein